MSSVLLCTGDPGFARGLHQILLQSSELRLSVVCSDLRLLDAPLDLHKPDILLLDLAAEPDQALLDWLHQVASQTKVVLRVAGIPGESAMRALSFGVRGVLRKTLPMEVLLQCLARVNEGQLWFDVSLTDSLLSFRRMLITPRENRLVVLLAQGLKNREIAGALGIEEGTVKASLSRLYRKLGVRDRYELALFGLTRPVTSSETAKAPVSRILADPLAVSAPTAANPRRR